MKRRQREEGEMARGVASIETQRTQNPGPDEEKPKVVVIMGPTGSGKSKLAIDLASHFPVEVINADSMQVYNGLDVLTNKVPLHEQKGTYFLPILPFFFIFEESSIKL